MSRPHGLVRRQQLLGAGISRDLIDNRVRAGWLRPLYRGVYAVGPVQSDEAPYLAAVLACGEGAVLGVRAAGFLWRMIRHEPRGPVDVFVPPPRCPRRPGIRAHRIQPFAPDEVTRLRAIPITTPARTLLDLAAELPMRELEQAIALAERNHSGTQRRLSALLARHPSRAGTAKLRELLDGSRKPALSRSEAEERLLALVRRAGLPVPETNVRVGPFELDLFWREHRVAVEVDGFAFHGDRSAFEADRRRDTDLAARGVQVIRITWRQLEAEPEAIIARLAVVLAVRG